MAEASLNSSGETPVKSSASSSSGCLFCGTQQTDWRTRTRLKGRKVKCCRRRAVFAQRSLIYCYKKIKRLEKLQEEEKLLKTELKKNFTSTNRFKRGVPSDSSLSKSTIAPTKSACHNHDQRTNKMIAKSLNFGSGIQEEGEKGPLLNIMPLDARPPASMTPASVPVAANVL